MPSLILEFEGRLK
jgi:hypothetical protein